MVPLPPQLGLDSAADLFRHPGHCCRTLLLGRTGRGIHNHDGQGGSLKKNSTESKPFLSAGDKVDGPDSDSNLHWTIYI